MTGPDDPADRADRADPADRAGAAAAADPATVDRVELWRVRVPLRRAHVAAHGTETVREVVLVALHGTDGIVGWGECDALSTPGYTAEWTGGAWLVLRDVLVPAWFAGRAGTVRGHPMAATAVGVAALDLALRRRGIRLAEALGAARHEVPSGRVVSGADVDEVVAAAVSAAEAGAALVKVKIHPDHDRAVLGAVRSALPEVALAADANGSYGSSDTDVLVALDEVDLTYLEQPFAPDDLVGHARLAGRLHTPVALDESATSRGALEAALALGACGAVNVKPARVGGLAVAISMAELAADAGIPAFVGGMLELGVGRAAALAVAALGQFTLPTDLGPSAAYVEDDITDPVIAGSAGCVALPAGHGVGVTPRAERLAACAVDHVGLRP